MNKEMSKCKTACKNAWKAEEDKKLQELVEVYGAEHKWYYLNSFLILIFLTIQ